MSGLILPSSVAPVNSLEQRNRCDMCGFECDGVHTRAFLHHVKRCAVEHEGDMKEAVLARAQSIFDGFSPDPERDTHFARGGR